MNLKKMGSFLKELRKEKGMTQEQLAEYLNVSGRTISRWETGSNMPDIDILIHLSDYYEVDIKELLDGERKSENMEKEVEETILKVADYSNNEKQQFARRLCILFCIAFVSFLVFFVMDSMGLADNSGIAEDIASLALGLPFGMIMVGILYTNGWLMKIKAFRKRNRKN